MSALSVLMHVTVFSDKKRRKSSLHFAGGNRSEKLIAFICDCEVNKKSERTLIEVAKELIACSPGLLKKMKPPAQDSK